MILSATKTCLHCKEDKEHDCFGKNKRQSDGLHYYCKICVKNITEQNKEKNDAYYKKWRHENKEKLRVYHKEYRRQQKMNDPQSPDSIQTKQSAAERKREKDKKRRQQETNKEDRRQYQKEKYLEDPQYKIKKLFESKLNRLLKKNDASNKSKDLIGCTIPEFKSYLESKFLPGMSWNNYGTQWQMDRIKPFCEFDLTDLEQQSKCFHYSNVQPLFIQTRLIDGVQYLGNMNKNKY